MNAVYYIGGGKGGVGKSLVSMAVVDWLRAREQDVLLIEGDCANPDVFKAYDSLVEARPIDFDQRDGWEELIDLFDKEKGRAIVINSGARVIQYVEAYGFLMQAAVDAGLIDLRVVWPINRSRDAVLALADFREVVTAGNVAVIRNLFFGAAKKFTRWAESPFAAQLMQSGAKVADLPELTDRLIDRLYDDRMPIEAALQAGTLVEKSSMCHWRCQVHTMLDHVL